jgi:DNA-binding transcriptional ArsR family regulator
MDDVERVAQVFKALSDPTRLRLVKLLSGQSSGECPGEECHGHGFLCVNALAHRLGVTQSAVSQHLRVLRQAGLVRGVRHGPFVHYSLDPDGLGQYRKTLVETLGEDFA